MVVKYQQKHNTCGFEQMERPQVRLSFLFLNDISLIFLFRSFAVGEKYGLPIIKADWLDACIRENRAVEVEPFLLPKPESFAEFVAAEKTVAKRKSVEDKPQTASSSSAAHSKVQMEVKVDRVRKEKKPRTAPIAKEKKAEQVMPARPSGPPPPAPVVTIQSVALTAALIQVLELKKYVPEMSKSNPEFPCETMMAIFGQSLFFVVFFF